MRAQITTSINVTSDFSVVLESLNDLSNYPPTPSTMIPVMPEQMVYKSSENDWDWHFICVTINSCKKVAKESPYSLPWVWLEIRRKWGDTLKYNQHVISFTCWDDMTHLVLWFSASSQWNSLQSTTPFDCKFTDSYEVMQLMSGSGVGITHSYTLHITIHTCAENWAVALSCLHLNTLHSLSRHWM